MRGTHLGFVESCPWRFFIFVDLWGGNLIVIHVNDTSFMYKSLWTGRQMVHVNSAHKGPGLQNLIHVTDEGVNASSRKTHWPPSFFTWSKVRRCTRAREGMAALQAVGQNVVIIRVQQFWCLFLTQVLQGILKLGVRWTNQPYWDTLPLQV